MSDTILLKITAIALYQIFVYTKFYIFIFKKTLNITLNIFAIGM